MNRLYKEDITKTISNINNIEKIKNSTIFISGSSGLIGTFLIDMFMYLNKIENYNTKIIANGRNEEKLKKKFNEYLESDCFELCVGDINDGINYNNKVDYIINCASNTHPKQYASDPIGTIMTNIRGTDNILRFASEKKVKKTLFLSSVEIYGVNVNNVDRFKETDMGYIDCNTLRAGYNESKRAGEALCQAYIEKNNLDISIVRLPRLYGPTLNKDDSKALSQFLYKGINGEDIVLKSEGNQYFSYLYVADAVSGLITTLTNGVKGEVYNLGSTKSDIRLKDLAKLIADYCNVEVVFVIPSKQETKGYSAANDARLDSTKIETELGWKPVYTIEEGIKNTIDILSNKNVKKLELKNEKM